MQAKDVPFAVHTVSLANEHSDSVYTRLNVSRNSIPRSEGATVFVNVDTGRISIQDGNAEVTPLAGILGAAPLPVPQFTAGQVVYAGERISLSNENGIYVRANVSRDVVPRDDNKTVFMNVDTGRLVLALKSTPAFRL